MRIWNQQTTGAVLLVGVVTLSIRIVLVCHKNRRLPFRRTVDFDLYVMAMSYQPEFCYRHRHEDFMGCHHPLEFWKSHLTIHGMWPENADGSWPSTCSHEPFSNQTVIDVGPQLDRMWPNIKVPKGDPEYYDFWEHEWTKHGTCSGLSQDDYFASALSEFLDTPSLVSENYGGTVSREELLKAYGGGIALVCSGGKFLEEVRGCLALKKDGTPTTRIPCPEVVLREDNCGQEIHIATFPSEATELRFE